MKKIAVVGSMNMDLSAQAERIPGKGETVAGHNLRYIPGGKGANQAVAASRLGGEVAMFGCVGEDAFGEQLIHNLRSQGVSTDAVRKVPGVATGLAMIVVAETDNSIVVIPGANAEVNVDYICSCQEKLLEADIILLQNEIPPETVSYVANICHAAGKAVLYNPAPAREVPLELWEDISFCTPNEHEVKLLFPEMDDLKMLMEQQHGKLIVTLGKDGAAAWDQGQLLKIPARPAQVVDTTGAGDTFQGAFAYALACEYEMPKALQIANIAASLATERFGAQGGMPEWKSLERELDLLGYVQ